MISSRAAISAWIDAAKRLVDPRRWHAAVEVMAELLSGGMVVPPAASASVWSEEEERAVGIVSIIQPDGDVQLKIDKAVAQDDDFERLVAQHLDQVADRLKLLHEAFDQITTLRVLFSLPAVAALVDTAANFVSAVGSRDSWAALLGSVNWWLAGAAGVGLLIALFSAAILGFFVRRRLKSFDLDLGAFEKRLYPTNAQAGRVG
ncbi:MAG: hypothetical protein GY791_02415 [Alphaproteobacteria bacterium]|nr:hypothetical protein [Alphaproteobacteria bacterium]